MFVFSSSYAVNQFFRSSTATEEVKPEEENRNLKKKPKQTKYCEVSAFLGGFSDYMLKRRPKVLETVLLEGQSLSKCGVANV